MTPFSVNYDELREALTDEYEDKCDVLERFLVNDLPDLEMYLPYVLRNRESWSLMGAAVSDTECKESCILAHVFVLFYGENTQDEQELNFLLMVDNSGKCHWEKE